MKNKNIIIVLLVTCLFLIGSASPASAEDGNLERREYVCMMQDSLLASPGIKIEHEGKTYYGCCPMCNEHIKKDPQKFTKAKDPVTKATVDKSSALLYAHNGRVYYFATEASRAEFAQKPANFTLEGKL